MSASGSLCKKNIIAAEVVSKLPETWRETPHREARGMGKGGACRLAEKLVLKGATARGSQIPQVMVAGEIPCSAVLRRQ